MTTRPDDEEVAAAPRRLPLDPAADERERLSRAAFEWMERHLQRREGPIHEDTPPGLIDDMLRPPPAQPADLAEVFARLEAAARAGWSKRHGGDLAYIPGGGLYTGALAAWLAAGVHAFTGASFEAPALVALEESVLRWLASSVFGLPAGAEGLLLSGGSMATQTATVCARHRGFDAGRSRAYVSERAHHSVAKALHLSGVAAGQIVTVPASPGGAVDAGALAQRLQADRDAGLAPWLIVGTAGTTDTGAIDDLGALADLAGRHGAWLHVDAAYGGMFGLTARGHSRLSGIERADSITVDMHKGLMLPYGIGALLVRHAGALSAAHEAWGHYMRDVPELPGLPHYFQRGPELTRPFRGLLVWLPLQLHGVAAFRAELDRCLDLAEDAARRLRACAGIAVAEGPALSVVAFRARAGDEATDRIGQALNASGRLHVSSTTLDGHAHIRLAFLHPRTGAGEIDTVMALVRARVA